jgi:hypothetical protein
MFSKILIKLVDEAVLPAILLIVARVVSVILVSRYFKVDFTIGGSGFVFPNANDYVLVNSYSTLSMIVVLAVGLLYILLKSLVFHDTHITPATSAKLFTLRLSSFIQASFDVYSQGAIWLSYMFLIMIVSGIMVLSGLLYSWVFVVALILSGVSTYLFVVDIEHELFSKGKKNGVESEEFVLKLGDIDEL